MTTFFKFILDDGTEVLIETSADKDGFQKAGASEIVQRSLVQVKNGFDAISKNIQFVHTNILNNFKSSKPDAIEIQFGIKIDAEAGALIAKTGISGHFNVTLSWNKP